MAIIKDSCCIGFFYILKMFITDKIKSQNVNQYKYYNKL